MRESAKTILFWILLLALFGFLYAVTQGDVYPVTGAKLGWIFAGVAVTVAVLTAGLALLAARNPHRLRGGWPRAAAFLGVAVLLLGGLFGICHAVLVVDAGPALAAGPLSIGALFIGLAASVVARARQRRRLGERLAKERTRALADAVIASVAKTTDRGARNEAAVDLIGGGFPRDALTLLEALAPTSDDERVMVACNIAIARLMLDDVPAANKILAAAPAGKSPTIVLWRRVMEARVLAHAGKGAKALAILDKLAFPDSPGPARRHAEITRAHALVARGDREAARALLTEIGATERADLERIAEHGGPAAPLAAELIAAAGQPFR